MKVNEKQIVEEEEEIKDNRKVDTQDSGFLLGRIIRYCVFAVVIILFLVIATTSSPKNPDLNSIRDERTILGNKNAKNHYIMITDVMCPYCDVFSRLVIENQEKFNQYLKDHDIVFEVRMTDYLHENGMSRNGYSRMGAEAIACATDENKFWEYYHQVIKRLWQDYHSKGIGSSKNAPAIKDIKDQYWLDIGKEIGLSENFTSCYSQHKMLDAVKENTAEATRYMTRLGTVGMPTFKFNNFINSGFDTNWDYIYVERYLSAGLKK